jgi:fructose-1,6-bisphosphatase II
MKKLITSGPIYDKFQVDNILELSIEEISKTLTLILGRTPVVSLLKRERHQNFIDKFRASGCKVKLVDDCDVFGSLRAMEAKIDLFYGIGGATETLLTASAVKAFRGRIEAQCVETNNWKASSDLLSNDDIINGYSVFVATGITDGDMLKGVEIVDGKITTHSFFSSDQESKTIRRITTQHGN